MPRLPATAASWSVRSDMALSRGGADNMVKRWDAGAGKEKATIEAHLGPVTCLAFSPDGKLLASGSKDKSAKLWDVGKALERKEGERRADAAPPLRQPEWKTEIF